MVIANSIMLALFLLAAVLQYNDPDPLLWICYYGVAAAFTGAALLRRYHWFAGVVALAFYAGFVYTSPGWGIETLLLLKEPKMSSSRVELAREAFGLLLCAFWMSVLTWVWFCRRGKMFEAGHATAKNRPWLDG
ncbi:MAG: transmembrane 220 family protein [Planctomycetes bacterium]|nr:transmembrane 220 family protein [Planctomycetota bacterium]